MDLYRLLARQEVAQLLQGHRNGWDLLAVPTVQTQVEEDCGNCRRIHGHDDVHLDRACHEAGSLSGILHLGLGCSEVHLRRDDQAGQRGRRNLPIGISLAD